MIRDDMRLKGTEGQCTLLPVMSSFTFSVVKQSSFLLIPFSLPLYLVAYFYTPHPPYLHSLTPLNYYLSKQINNGFLSSPLRLWFISEGINASVTHLWWSRGAVTSVTHYSCTCDESAANPSRAQPGQLHMKHPGKPDRYHRSDNMRPEQVRLDWSDLN